MRYNRDRLLAALLIGQLTAAVVFGGVLVHALNRRAAPVTVSATTLGAPTGAAPVGAGAPPSAAHAAAPAPAGTLPAAAGASTVGSAGTAARTVTVGGATTGGAPTGGSVGTVAPGAPITIGSIVTQTGSINFGSSALATKAYFDMVNAAGGVNGHQIRLELRDDQLQQSTGLSEAQQLINDKVFLFGAWNAPQTEAGIQSVLDNNRIPLIGSYGEAVEYSDPYAYAFSADYVHFGYVMGRFLVSHGSKKPALLYIDNSDSVANGQIERGFADGVRAAGGNPTAVTVTKVAVTQPAYDDTISQYRINGVDGIASLLDDTGYSRLLQSQARAQYYPTHIADPLFDRPAVRSAAGADGTYLATDLDFIDLGAPEVTRYVHAVQAEFGSSAAVDYIGEQGWLDAQLLVAALRKAGTNPTRASVVAALQSLSGTQTGMTLPLHISGAKHDMNRCLKIGKLVGGKVEQVSDWSCDSEVP